jgi:hypothetical protein
VDTNSQVLESPEVLAYLGGSAYASEWSRRPTHDEPYLIGTARQHLNTHELARLTLLRSRLEDRSELAGRHYEQS